MTQDVIKLEVVFFQVLSLEEEKIPKRWVETETHPSVTLWGWDVVHLRLQQPVAP